MNLSKTEMDTVLRCVDKMFDFRSERDRLRDLLATLEAENKALRDRFSDADTERNAAQAALKAAFARVAELEARCKRLEEAAREVYLDSIASDHQWSTNEARNMHALRDVLEARPAETAKPCPYCLRVECECSDFDVAPDMGDK